MLLCFLFMMVCMVRSVVVVWVCMVCVCLGGLFMSVISRLFIWCFCRVFGRLFMWLVWKCVNMIRLRVWMLRLCRYWLMVFGLGSVLISMVCDGLVDRMSVLFCLMLYVIRI